MTAPWPSEFDTLVRSHLPDFPSDAPLPPDGSLVALGLESVGLVGLMADLEATYGCVVPEELSSPENFHTAGTVWAVVEKCRTTRP
jgi:acyl carrier protein